MMRSSLSTPGLCVRLVLLPLVWSALGLAAAETSKPESTVIIFVRHAEKVAPKGDIPLSERGRERSKALAYMLQDVKLQAIYTSQMIRTIQTGQPLSEAAGVKSQPIAADKEDVLIEKLKQLKPGGKALVVGHSNTIPSLIEKLGGGKIPPIPEEEYDRLLIMTIPATGSPTLVNLRYGGR